MIKNKQVLLASRPVGWVKESDFQIVETELAGPTVEGQLLLKNLYLSLDPYMRGRMNDSKSYAAKTELGDVMGGGTLSQVVEVNNNPKYQPGDIVVAQAGWQEYTLSDGRGLMKIDTHKAVPLSAYLGVVGMPGVTAWYGLFKLGKPKAGETVVVSAASGAVGGVVGQLAKWHGCRVVGIAGGKTKCDFAVQELGFDACIDYKAEGNFYQALREAVPNGIDVYFENVGGEILDAVLRLVNPFARIPLCGLISQYNETQPYAIRNFASFLSNRVTMEGFIIAEHMEIWPQALAELGQKVAEGKLKYHETIAEGLDNAPQAFIGMLKGENFGKQLVKLS
jgi:NADPH-dependent curcumin reductase CurA